MTLNGIIALILLYFTLFNSFAGLLRNVTVVEDSLDRPIYCVQNKLIVFHFWPKLTHLAALGLSAIAELLVLYKY